MNGVKIPVLIVVVDCLWLENRRTIDVIKWFKLTGARSHRLRDQRLGTYANVTINQVLQNVLANGQT